MELVMAVTALMQGIVILSLIDGQQKLEAKIDLLKRQINRIETE